MSGCRKRCGESDEGGLRNGGSCGVNGTCCGHVLIVAVSAVAAVMMVEVGGMWLKPPSPVILMHRVEWMEVTETKFIMSLQL